MGSTSTSPCAACKSLRRKCTYECIFAPYFPPDQPQKFALVDYLFDTTYVEQLLNELTPNRREGVVNSLAFEAECRLRYPEFGILGVLSIFQQKLRQAQVELFNLKKELSNSKKELSNYIGPSAMIPLVHQHRAIMNPTYGAYGARHIGEQAGGLGFGEQAGGLGFHQYHAIMNPTYGDRHFGEQQELMRNFQQQQLQQQHEMARFNQAGRGAGADFDPMGANVPRPKL